MSRRRLEHEFKELNNDMTLDCYAVLNVPRDMYKWKVYMSGPEGTPYESGTFLLQVDFSSDHPFKPPTIVFTTRVYHPNISESGDICIDILKSKWSPVLSMSKVIVSLQSLLGDPNPLDPLDLESAELFLNDREEFNKKAVLWTRMYSEKRKNI